MTSRSRNGPGTPGHESHYAPHAPKKSSSRELNPYLSDIRPENRHTLCTIMAQLAEESSPMFAVTPKSRAVSEDTDVRFTCTVSGHPEPEVLWYRDDEQLDRFCGLPKYEILREGKVHTLKLYRCTEEDAAIYQVSARNTKGIVSCSAVLEVATMNEFKIHQRWFNKLKAKAEARRCEAARAPGKENKGKVAYDGAALAKTAVASTMVSRYRSPEWRTRRKRRSPDLHNPSPSSSPSSVRTERARSRATTSPKRAAHMPRLGRSSERGVNSLAGAATSPSKRVAGRPEPRQDMADAKLNGFHSGLGTADREAAWKSGLARGGEDRGGGNRSRGGLGDGGEVGGGVVAYVMETVEEITTTCPPHKPDASHFKRDRATVGSAAVPTPVATTQGGSREPPETMDTVLQREQRRNKQRCNEELRSPDPKVPTVGEYLRELLHGTCDGSEPSASEESEKVSEEDMESSESTTPTETLAFPTSPMCSLDDFVTAMSTGSTDDDTLSGWVSASEPPLSSASRPDTIERSAAATSPGQGMTDAESDLCEDFYDTADEESPMSPDFSSEAVDSSSDMTEEFGDSYYTLSDGLPSPDSDRTETPLYFYSPSETPVPSDDTDVASRSSWFTGSAGGTSTAPASTDTGTDANSSSGRSSSLLGSLAYLAGSPDTAGTAWNTQACHERDAVKLRQEAVARPPQTSNLNLPLMPPPPALPPIPLPPRQQPAQSPVEYYVVEAPRRRATPGPHGRERRDEYFQTSGPTPPPDSPEAAVMLLHRGRWAPAGFVQQARHLVHQEGGHRDVQGGIPSPPPVRGGGSQRPPSAPLSTDSADDTCSYAHITSPLSISAEDSASTTETELEQWPPVEDLPTIEPGPVVEPSPHVELGPPAESEDPAGRVAPEARGITATVQKPGGTAIDGVKGSSIGAGSSWAVAMMEQAAGFLAREIKVDSWGAHGKRYDLTAVDMETSEDGSRVFDWRAGGDHDAQRPPVLTAVLTRGEEATARTGPSAERPSSSRLQAGGTTCHEADNAVGARKQEAPEMESYLENLGREKQQGDSGKETLGQISQGDSSTHDESSVFVFKLLKAMLPPVQTERTSEQPRLVERDEQVSTVPPPAPQQQRDYLVISQQEETAVSDSARAAIPPKECLVEHGKGSQGDEMGGKSGFTDFAVDGGNRSDEVSAENPKTDGASESRNAPESEPASPAVISVETERRNIGEGNEQESGLGPALPTIRVEDTSMQPAPCSPLLARLRGAGYSPETARRAMLPSATPQELASGARRKVFIPRGVAPDGVAAVPQPFGGEPDGSTTAKQPAPLGSDAPKLLLPTTGKDAQAPMPSDGAGPTPAFPAELKDAESLEKVAAPPSPKTPSTKEAASPGPEATEEPREDMTTGSPGCPRRLRGWDAVPGPGARVVEQSGPSLAEESAGTTVHDPFKAPQLLRKIRVDAFPDLAGNLKLWCQFYNVLTNSRVAWSRNGALLAEMELSAEDEGPTSLALPQASRKDHGVYTCTVTNRHGTASAELHLTHEVLRELVNRDEVKDGEEIEMTPLVFAKGARDTSHWGERFFGRIITEDAPLGGVSRRKVFRTRVVYGLAPLFESGSTCVLKVHGAIAYSTRRDTTELVAKNQKLTVEVCKSQNTAREYCKLFGAEARAIEAFGGVPEIVPVYMIFRPGSHVPHATLEPELSDRMEEFVPEGAPVPPPGPEGEAHEKCHTLRHWLYLWTSGNLIVTNAKGVGLTLTDVDVATRFPETAEWAPTPAPHVLDAFRDAHSCNRYCALLQLRPLRGPPAGLPGSPQTAPRGLAPRSPGVTRKNVSVTPAPRSSPQTTRKATLSVGGGAGSPTTPRRASFSSPQSTRKFLSTSPQAPRKRTISGGHSPRQPSSPQAPRRDTGLQTQGAPGGAALPAVASPHTDREHGRC